MYLFNAAVRDFEPLEGRQTVLQEWQSEGINWIDGAGREYQVAVGGKVLVDPDYENIKFFLIPNSSDLDEDDILNSQAIESNLMENGERDNFEIVANILTSPSDETLWEGFQGVPSTGFSFRGTRFGFSVLEEGNRPPETLYPLWLYEDRRKSTGVGENYLYAEQTSLKPLRDNIREVDRNGFLQVVDTLLENGADLFVTGSILETSDYNDIDLMVGATRYSLSPSEMDELMEEISGKALPEIECESNSTEKDMEDEEIISDNYLILDKLYSFEKYGIDFHIGYEEHPFRVPKVHSKNDRINQRYIDSDLKFARL